jgi:hypothetical protein
MRPRSRVRIAAAALLGVTFLLGACSSAQYQYVRDTDTRTAFRVPTTWTIFDERSVLGLPEGPEASVPEPIKWLVGIDGSPSASVSNILDASALNSDYPEGIGLVQEFSFEERDTASIRYLRNFLFPIDVMIQNASDADMLTYDDEILQNGFHGLHMIVQFRASALSAAISQSASSSTPSTSETSGLQGALLGGQGASVLSPEFIEVDQKVLVDDATHRIYFLAILCSADCYQRNKGAIEAAVDSWTVIA